MKLVLDEHNQLMVELIFKDLNIDISSIRKLISFTDIDYSTEYLDTLIQPFQHLNYPLLIEDKKQKEESFLFQDNLITFNNCYYFLKGLEEEDFSAYNNNYGNYINEILSGQFVFLTLGDKFFTIDYKKYNFYTSREMFLCLGAFIYHNSNYEDDRVFNVKHGNILYSYENHIHGDFRLIQFDITYQPTFNIVTHDEYLPFCEPTIIGSILGYHSIEHVFLITLLSYMYYTDYNSVILTEHETYLKQFPQEEQRFGNFGDAGQSPFFFFTPDSKERIYFPNLPAENHAYYEPLLIENQLRFQLHQTDGNYKNISSKITNMHIDLEIVEELINALFLKVINGNGRSSFKILEEALKRFINRTG